MKSLFSSFCAAFSLYSVLPMPRVAWDKSNMRYALCFFPLVGVLIGGLQFGWVQIAVSLSLVPGFAAAISVLIPILISGGIHMDGWIDTVDALSSHADISKKQEILKDPHVGAFGVIGCVCYILLQWGLWQQLIQTPAYVPLVAVGYVLSRAYNALSIATFPTAKRLGLVYTFQDGAVRQVAAVTCGMLIVGISLACVRHSVLIGGICTAAILLYFCYHRWFCKTKFGGNSGDLAGFLLQNIETIFLFVAVAGGVLK